MRLFKRSPAAPESGAKTQLRAAGTHPFGMLQNYTPLSEGNIRCYRAIREALPIIDAAIGKIVRLCSGFHVSCENAAEEAELNRFLVTVNTGRGQRGLQSFLDCYLDSMLTCGRAVGEIVTAANGREIAAVLCGDVTGVAIRESSKTPLRFEICYPGFGEPEPLPFQDLLLFTPYAPETGHPYGVSLLRSMPYLADVLMTIYHSVESNFRRSGNLRYAVTYRPGGDALDRANAAGRLQQIAREWSSAMQNTKNGSVRDFVALGDVDIRTIGADSRIPDTEGAVRQILEQLISKTGLPPFLLGLSWSSTERMSAQQADLLTSELTTIRRALTPVIRKICDLWLALHGFAVSDYEVAWDDINLQDQVEEAKARWYDAQTERIQGEKREV